MFEGTFWANLHYVVRYDRLWFNRREHVTDSNIFNVETLATLLLNDYSTAPVRALKFDRESVYEKTSRCRLEG